MEIRDPVHGFIQMDNDFVPFLDLRVMQRLRRIKQTAMANLLYPGANHTRFEHSLGCFHVAGRLATTMHLDEVRNIKLAALLHDVGHGPFSHVSEQLLAENTAGSLATSKGLHEKVTLSILTHDEEARTLLGDRFEEVSKLLSYDPSLRSVAHDIVSGPFDADKLDYLLRDSHYAGVKYGVFDLERIINTVTAIPDGSQSIMGIREDGFWAIEQLVLARHYMLLQVHQHRLRGITDAMLVRGSQLAIRDGDRELGALFRFSDTPEFVQRYLASNDDSLMKALVEGHREKAMEFAARLIDRRLFKQVFSKYLRDFRDARTRRNILQLSREALRPLEEQIAEAMEPFVGTLDPDFVILNIQSISNPTFMVPGADIGVNGIVVLLDDDDGTVKNATEMPNTLLGGAIKPTEEAVSVYVPLEGLNKDQRHEVYQQVRRPISAILEAV